MLLLAFSAQGVACAANMGTTEKGKNPVQHGAIEAVLERHNDQLLSLPGVVGTAVGKCAERPCIKILAVKKTPELLKRVPQTLEGFPVVVEETGEFQPLRSS